MIDNQENIAPPLFHQGRNFYNSHSHKTGHVLSRGFYRQTSAFEMTNSQSWKCPLPHLNWTQRQECWSLMTGKESQYRRSPFMFENHNSLEPSMRTILLDWLSEVCDVYKLHRETFYLAVDYVDRYLSVSRNVRKGQLQLVGVSALFIAAKLEEIYPPKLHEFSTVTDGACSDKDILCMELVLLHQLDYYLSPITPVHWLSVFLQTACSQHQAQASGPISSGDGFVTSQFSSRAFVQLAQFIDLCVLDVGCNAFPYSILAASALYHFSNEQLALNASGLEWVDIAACVNWMVPFATTIREIGPCEPKTFAKIPDDDMHNIQAHAVSVQHLDMVKERQRLIAESLRSSPTEGVQEICGLPTPPFSNHKNSGNSRDDLSQAITANEITASISVRPIRAPLSALDLACLSSTTNSTMFY